MATKNAAKKPSLPVKKSASAAPAKSSKPAAKKAAPVKPAAKKAAPAKKQAPVVAKKAPVKTVTKSKPAAKSAPAKKQKEPMKKATTSKTTSKPAPKNTSKPAAKAAPAKKAAPAPAKKAAPAPAKKAAPAPAKKAAPAPAKKAAPAPAKKAAPAPAKKAAPAKPAPKAAPAKPAAKVAPVKAAPVAAPVAPAPKPVKVPQLSKKQAQAHQAELVKKVLAAKAAANAGAKPMATPAAKPLEKKPQIIVAHRRLENKSRTTQETEVMAPYQPEVYRSLLDEAPIPVTPVYRYSDEELVEFKELITSRLDAARKELVYLQGLITRKDEAGTEDTENRYMNMEDGSGAMEREQLAQLASRQIQFMNHLEKALIRIENKTYGICRVTGKLIEKARLRAVPHATLSIEAKKMLGSKQN